MMPSPLDLPTLLAGMPHASKLVTAEVVKSEVHQHVFGPVLVERLLEREREIQRVAKKERLAKADRDGHQDNRPGYQSNRRKQDEDESPSSASNASPWAGNIINVKV